MNFNSVFKQCFDSELLVKQTEETEAPFQVGIQNGSNPLGFGTVIGRYSTESEAIRHADHFCQFYTIAKEKGYHFKNKVFVKSEKKDIPVEQVMKSLRKTADFDHLFEH
jgi:hypothetical protein